MSFSITTIVTLAIIVLFPAGIIAVIISNDTSNADNDSKIIDAIVAEYPEAVIINKTNIRKKEWIVRVFMLWLFLYFLIYFLCPKNNGKF